MDVCPLIFKPIFKSKVWGAANLAGLLDKDLPSGETIGESWECADLEAGQSVVAGGPAAGQTLQDLMAAWGESLLGRAKPADGRFPLLIKFLDAAQDLSVQVHPDPETAKRLGGNVRVKHEAWHIIAAEPGACIYRGVVPGTTIETLRAAMAADPESILEHLQRIPVKPGQTYYLPSGTLHALGAGVVVAEVQTPSDITYRLYDWGRVRPEQDAGLHIEEGLACVNTEIDFAQFEKRTHVSSLFTTVTRLVTCPSFVIEKVRFVGGLEQEVPYAEPVCWILLDGAGEILYGKNGCQTFKKGDVVLLPAALPEARIKTETDCLWLEVTIPTPSDLAAYPRVDREALQAGGGGTVPLNIQVKKPTPSDPD